MVFARNKIWNGHIERAYLSASLGEISASQFWQDMGLNPAVENEYLSQHKLRPDLITAIERACGRFDHTCCLSNDVSEWSVKLRQRFGMPLLWLPQATIANLYQVTPQAITQHIKAIYEEGVNK